MSSRLKLDFVLKPLEKHDDPVCDDPEGTDRAKAHDAIADAIVRFMRQL